MTDDLVAFLNARIDEEEAGAWELHPGTCATAGPISFPCDCGYPARVRRDVEAKRKILARYEFANRQVAAGAVNEAAGYGKADAGWLLRADSLLLDVLALAAVYSDHPDYDPAWSV